MLGVEPEKKSQTSDITYQGSERMDLIKRLVEQKDEEITRLRTLIERLSKAVEVGKPEVLELPGIPDWGSTLGTIRPAA